MQRWGADPADGGKLPSRDVEVGDELFEYIFYGELGANEGRDRSILMTMCLDPDRRING